mgnify:CR=1 FL=1
MHTVFFAVSTYSPATANPIGAGNVHKDQQIVTLSAFRFLSGNGEFRKKSEIFLLSLQIYICLYPGKVIPQIQIDAHSRPDAVAIRIDMAGDRCGLNTSRISSSFFIFLFPLLRMGHLSISFDMATP